MTSVTPETKLPARATRWDSVVWPRWLPVHARLPLIAQITGAVALTALIVGPWWASAPDAIPATTESIPIPVAAVPLAPAVPEVSPTVAPAPPVVVRPAHLNLDVRHSFRNVDFTVMVDGKPVLQTRLEGSGKRFGVFGKRSERGYTKTLELSPGTHLVRVRILSADEKFDQVRVERFDLGSASVASMRISADKSGLTLIAERPPAPAPVVAAAPAPTTSAPAPSATLAAAQTTQASTTVGERLQSIRAMLIGIASFVASTATAFVFEEWLKKRKQQLLALGRLSRRRKSHHPPLADENENENDRLAEPDQERTA